MAALVLDLCIKRGFEHLHSARTTGQAEETLKIEKILKNSPKKFQKKNFKKKFQKKF
jgi:hypothetical protein